jgi:hypothetical protein
MLTQQRFYRDKQFGLATTLCDQFAVALAKRFQVEAIVATLRLKIATNTRDNLNCGTRVQIAHIEV